MFEHHVLQTGRPHHLVVPSDGGAYLQAVGEHASASCLLELGADVAEVREEVAIAADPDLLTAFGWAQRSR